MGLVAQAGPVPERRPTSAEQLTALELVRARPGQASRSGERALARAWTEHAKAERPAAFKGGSPPGSRSR